MAHVSPFSRPGPDGLRAMFSPHAPTRPWAILSVVLWGAGALYSLARGQLSDCLALLAVVLYCTTALVWRPLPRAGAGVQSGSAPDSSGAAGRTPHPATPAVRLLCVLSLAASVASLAYGHFVDQWASLTDLWLSFGPAAFVLSVIRLFRAGQATFTASLLPWTDYQQ